MFFNARIDVKNRATNPPIICIKCIKVITYNIEPERLLFRPANTILPMGAEGLKKTLVAMRAKLLEHDCSVFLTGDLK